MSLIKELTKIKHGSGSGKKKRVKSLNLRVWKLKDGKNMKTNVSTKVEKDCVLTGFSSDKHCDSLCSPA